MKKVARSVGTLVAKSLNTIGILPLVRSLVPVPPILARTETPPKLKILTQTLRISFRGE